MHFLTPVLSLCTIALASPIITSDNNGLPPAFPPTSTSRGFNLIVNVTDLSRDFTPSIHGRYVNTIHVGAGQSLLGLGNKDQYPRVFYVNGTALDVRLAHSTVIADGGTPPSPFGISFTKDNSSEIAHTAHLNAGSGDRGIGLTHFPVPYTFLYPETYAICKESISYHHGKIFLIVKQFQLRLETWDDIPTSCVPVRLFAQCAKLADLPMGSFSSHQWAYESSCYDNVAGIDWSKYSPW